MAGRGSRWRLAAAGVLGALLLAAPASANRVLVAHDGGTATHWGPVGLGPAGGPGAVNTHMAQSFVAPEAGRLATISTLVTLESNAPDPGDIVDGGGEDLSLEIWRVGGGLPTILLGAVVVDESSVPVFQDTGYSVTGDYASHEIDLVAGQNYSIVMGTVTGTSGEARYHVWGTAPPAPGYLDGDALISTDGGFNFASTAFDVDLQFEVTVVPEPATGLLLAAGLLGLVFATPSRAGRSR